MPQSAHEILGLAKGANDADIRRAYRKTLSRIETDTALTDAQRKVQSDKLDAAFRELTSHGKAGGGATALISPTLVAAVLGVAIAGGGMAWYWKVEQARQAEERERILAEQKEAARQKELAERAERERVRIQEEIRAQKEADEAARKAEIEMRQQDMKSKQFVEDNRPELKMPSRNSQYGDYYNQQQAYQNERNRQYQEYRQRYEDDQATARARAETERQKRYLEDRAREEEIARLRRDAAARSAR